ncbi:MAG: hypothetical protein MUF45_17185 [Spirosomaceae bacterium]|nr:hypothetical protein [Spirosomataceae bacterium]
MNKLFLICTIALMAMVSTTFAQSLTQNTTFLAQKLNALSNDKDDNAHFSFKGCQMNIDVKDKDKDDDFNFGMTISWQLKEVRKVSYVKTKDGFYDLKLDVPADKIKMNLGFGNDNSVNSSFNVKDSKDSKNSHTSFDLKTKDEATVKEIAARFESVVNSCKNTK